MTGGAGADRFDISDVAVSAIAASIADFAEAEAGEVIVLAAANTTLNTAAGLAPVLATSNTASPGNGIAYIPNVSTTTNDVIALSAASYAAGGRTTSETPAKLFIGMAANANDAHTISQITASTAGDKFYIIAYDNNDVFIFFADAGAGNTAVQSSEVNLVAIITGPNIAVGGMEAGDFVLA
jgi:hypothetical protein